MRAWSYSSLNTFANCPRQYYLRYVSRQIPYQESDATKWGSEVHTALENYAKHGAPLPPHLDSYRPLVDKILSLPGEKRFEYPLAFTRNLEPCSFDDESAWCRGVIDVLAVDGENGLCVDWKTGKVREDSDQLMLFAAMMFQQFSSLQRVKSLYVWLKYDKTTKRTYTREELPELWQHFLAKARRLEHAYDSNKWLPNPSGLCNGWCGAEGLCEFWKPKRK